MEYVEWMLFFVLVLVLLLLLLVVVEKEEEEDNDADSEGGEASGGIGLTSCGGGRICELSSVC